MSKEIGKMELTPPPKTPEEKLLHVIGIMRTATKTRMEYFAYRHEQNVKYLDENIDRTTGKLPSKNGLYESIHADYVFSAIQGIETLHGALLTTYTLMTTREPNLKNVTASLINPGRKLDTIQDLLSEGSLNHQDICNLSAIPYPDSFSSPEKNFLERVFAPTFERISDLCYYSQAFLDTFKPVRNVFAHNFRFVYFDDVTSKIKTSMAESILGFLEPQNIEINNLLLIGDLQRIVFPILVSELGNLEYNVLTGLRDFVLNNMKPVLPRKIVDLNENDKNEYMRIFNSQGYQWPNIQREGEGVGEIGIQKGLYHDFMNYVTEKIDREIVVVQDGIKRIAKFEKSSEEMKTQLRELQAELRRKRNLRKGRRR